MHSAAPAELVNAIYWLHVAELQSRRAAGEPVDAELYLLTRSYEQISDQPHRGEYDAFIGFGEEPLITRRLTLRRRSLRSRLLRRKPAPPSGVDLYEVLGLDPSAPAAWADEAYRIMRDCYLRVPDGRRRAHLLDLLDDAHAMITDPGLRARYDALRRPGPAYLPRQGGSTTGPAATGTAPPGEHPGGTPREVTPPAPDRRVAEPPPAGAPLPSGDGAESPGAGSQGRARLSLAPLGRVLGGACLLLWRLLTSVVRLVLRGLSASVSAFRSWRADRAAGHRAMRERQEAPAQRVPAAQRTKRDQEVEEALLGRIASTVQSKTGEDARPKEQG